MKENKQVIEVDYKKELVEKYKKNYIMEEDGIGAELDAEPFDIQNNFNEVPFEEMIEEGEAVIDDKNN